MTILKRALPAILLLFLLSSCPWWHRDYDEIGPLGQGEFYAQNFKTRNYYKLKASLLAEGNFCEIWVENGSAISEVSARAFAARYDNFIRPKMLSAFSEENFQLIDRGITHQFNDVLEYANYLAGNNNNKLTILLLDIQDNYHVVNSPSYVAGYFYGGNFLEKGLIPGTRNYSNSRDMIYIDTYPGLRNEGSERAYATFAHELQHLINFCTSVLIGRDRTMDLWIDEGLSSQAEYIYLEENPRDKIDWFNRSDTIKKGNNFFVWDNHNEDMAILDEYATVYLFFRWLYLQANTQLKATIFKEIITSNQHDYRAVTEAAIKINSSWDDLGTLLRTWFAANYDPANENFGYKDDASLHGLKVHPIGGADIRLFPGEGVYSIINGSANKTVTGNINYAGLKKNQSPNTSSPFAEEMLLTYNTNLNLIGPSEPGSLTGIEPPSTSSVSRTLADDTKETGPFILDARDVLGRGSDEEIFTFFKAKPK